MEAFFWIFQGVFRRKNLTGGKKKKKRSVLGYFGDFTEWRLGAKTGEEKRKHPVELYWETHRKGREWQVSKKSREKKKKRGKTYKFQDACGVKQPQMDSSAEDSS